MPTNHTLFRFGATFIASLVLGVLPRVAGDEVLTSFDGAAPNSPNLGGAYPTTGLVLSGDALYGLTAGGGKAGGGTLFSIRTNDAAFRELYSFPTFPRLDDGRYPKYGLVHSGNRLYGTTYLGGSTSNGLVFAIQTDGSGFTKLHEFTGADGRNPGGSLTLVSNVLYGTTENGGAGSGTNAGTVYSIRTDGTGFTTVHDFPWEGINGLAPFGASPMSGVVMGPSGKRLFGTTRNGGSYSNGTVFAVNTDGSGFAVLRSFQRAPEGYFFPSEDGCWPIGGLVLSPSGDTLYGTTYAGGATGHGTVFSIRTDGGGFRTVRSFPIFGAPDAYYAGTTSPSEVGTGVRSVAPLVFSSNGRVLYGSAVLTTSGPILVPGITVGGAVFALTTDGSRIETIYKCGSYREDGKNADGSLPNPVMRAGKALYGTMLVGGVEDGGIAFSLDLGLGANVTATPEVVHLDDTITVVVDVLNRDAEDFRNVQIDGPITLSTNHLVSGPTPRGTTLTPVLPPITRTTFTNLYKATNYGSLYFTASAVGTGMDGRVTSPPWTSSKVTIAPRGDLLLRRAVEPKDRFAGADVFQTLAAAPQIKTNVAGINSPSTFQIRIVNQEKTPATYTLTASLRTDVGYRRTYLLGNRDVTAAMEAPGGFTLPPIAAGSPLLLDVIMVATNNLATGVRRVDFKLAQASDPSVALDVVEAVTTFTSVIVVNSTGDLPNADPNGCCCDTGRLLADRKTRECTLRAAIQLANRLEGQNIVQFQIPSDDPGIVDGVPSIRPATELPKVTDTLIIDGWTQAPGAARPPVELSGQLTQPRKPVLEAGLFNLDWGRDARLVSFPSYLVENLPSGLHLLAAACEIRGLVIGSFPLCGILVEGPECVIQGNYLGLDATGTASAPSGLPLTLTTIQGPVFKQGREYTWLYELTDRAIDLRPKTTNIETWSAQSGGGGAQLCVRSAGNLIGGTDQGSGNVISGGPNVISPGGQTQIGWVGTPGLVVYGEGSGGNTIQGNIIGLDASASRPPTVPAGDVVIDRSWSATDVLTPKVASGQFMGVWIIDSPGNRIGGSTAAAGNLVAGNIRAIEIQGDTATENLVEGNQVGWTPAYPNPANDQQIGIRIASRLNTVGGNVIGGLGFGIVDAGGSNVVAGNWIGVRSDSTTPTPAVRCGVLMDSVAGSQVLSNTVADAEGKGIDGCNSRDLLVSANQVLRARDEGIRLTRSSASRIVGNQVRGSGDQGILMLEPGRATVVSQNTVRDCGDRGAFGPGHGICVLAESDGQPVTISQNSISHNAGLGIGFNRSGAPEQRDEASLPVRIILAANPPPIWAGGTLRATGTLVAPAGGGVYVLEFFANPAADPGGFGEGETWLGSAVISVGLLGSADIDVSLPSPGSLVGQFLTATATGPDGATTEFSRAHLIESCVPGAKGLCPDTEGLVPNPPAAHAPMRLASPEGFGDGNGDGIPDWQQDNVASLPSLPGLWLTLSAPGTTALQAVRPTGPPEFESLPAGYVFPIGFVSCELTHVAAGGLVTLTNLLHLHAAADFPYAATTYFCFGPTPDQPAPHWYEFAFDGVTGAELRADRILLHLQDGGRGDHDLLANGEIVTLGAPAGRRAPQPALTLQLAAIGSLDLVGYTSGTNDVFVTVTNSVPTITAVLSWPAGATGAKLQFLDAIIPGALSQGDLPDLLWQPVSGNPSVVNGWNVLTNTLIGSAGFYRLH